MASEDNFKDFLEEFIPVVETKSRQLNKLLWILETTGSKDAAEVKAELDAELRGIFSDVSIYEKLMTWKEVEREPIRARELDLLIKAFKENMLPKELLLEIATVESKIAQEYANFRPVFEDRALTENDVREMMKSEKNVKRRQKVWESSKEVGSILSKLVLEVVNLRNKAARHLGYENYFLMQLELQEIDYKWLKNLFDDLAKRSEKAYLNVLDEINDSLAAKFKVKKEEIAPWAWSDPFCQEDPLEVEELDVLASNLNIIETAKSFFEEFGFDVEKIINASDLYEREGKNQHAFCINIDRSKKDVRTLNNIRPSLRWTETILHEFGHAVYELNYNDTLPWLLKEPPHVFMTEAIALLCGRQAYNPLFFEEFSVLDDQKKRLLAKLSKSLKRRELIFSRFVLVMTNFEAELYKDPSQDLNKLWWELVNKYQKIAPPKSREGSDDWASKYHIALAPVYYHSYLLGELFASSLLEKITVAEKWPWNNAGGDFLKKNLFYLGSSMSWQRTVEKVLSHDLKPDSWLKDFA